MQQCSTDVTFPHVKSFENPLAYFRSLEEAGALLAFSSSDSWLFGKSDL